jgi:hypothetical protein
MKSAKVIVCVALSQVRVVDVLMIAAPFVALLFTRSLAPLVQL